MPTVLFTMKTFTDLKQQDNLMIDDELEPVPFDEIPDWIEQLFRLSEVMNISKCEFDIEVRAIANVLREAWSNK